MGAAWTMVRLMQKNECQGDNIQLDVRWNTRRRGSKTSPIQLYLVREICATDGEGDQSRRPIPPQT